MTKCRMGFRSGVRSLFSIYELYTVVIKYYLALVGRVDIRGGVRIINPHPKKRTVAHTYICSEKNFSKISGPS